MEAIITCNDLGRCAILMIIVMYVVCTLCTEMCSSCTEISRATCWGTHIWCIKQLYRVLCLHTNKANILFPLQSTYSTPLKSKPFSVFHCQNLVPGTLYDCVVPSQRSFLTNWGDTKMMKIARTGDMVRYPWQNLNKNYMNSVSCCQSPQFSGHAWSSVAQTSLQIDWSTSISGWSDHCHKTCLQSAVTLPSPSSSTRGPPDLSQIPWSVAGLQ